MKKIILFVVTLLLLTTISQAQFTSVQDGLWHLPSTWSTDPNATAIPDENSSVVINHIISIANGDKCNNLLINNKVYGGEDLQIFGNLINYGELRDDPNHGSDYLTVTIYGNIINNGVYITGTTNFEGSFNHHLRTYNGNTISFGSAFSRNDSSTFIIDSVASISGNLLLAGSKMILPGGYSTPDTLILDGGLIDGGIIECNNNVLFGKGVIGTIGFNGVFAEQQHTFVKDAILEGYINFNGSSIDSTIGTITFLGNVVNNGTIITKPNNSGNYANIFIEGEFTNNGIVQRQSSGFELRFLKNGNITNNGELLGNKMIFYDLHTFINNSDSIGVSEIKGVDSNSTLTIVGNLVSNYLFNGSYYLLDINMNGGKMILPQNGKLINFGMDNTILEANNSMLANTFTSYFKTTVKSSIIVDPKIQYLNTSNRTKVIGEVEIITDGIFQGNATLNCNIVNNGNMSASSDTTTGDIINNGVWNSGHRLVGNIVNTGIINLSVWEISGNIANEGSWKSYTILINGKEDQLIDMPTDSTIHSNSIVFDAMLDGTNYQWTRNGVDIAGENGNTLTLLTDLQPDNATYSCNVDGVTSRNIIIQSLTDVEEDNVAIPIEYKLSQNYPNPFNPSTVISFALPTTGNVSLKVFNSLGQEVAELISSGMNAGYHSFNFNAEKFSSGIYFYRIQTNNFTKTKKMLLIK